MEREIVYIMDQKLFTNEMRIKQAPQVTTKHWELEKAVKCKLKANKGRKVITGFEKLMLRLWLGLCDGNVLCVQI
jgi:hypothetical protein